MIIDVLRMSSAMATVAELLRGERRAREQRKRGGRGVGGREGRKGTTSARAQGCWRRRGKRGEGEQASRRVWTSHFVNRGPNLLTEPAVPTRQQVDAHFFWDMGSIFIGARAALMLPGSVRTTASASERARDSGERSRATFDGITLGNRFGAKMHKRPTCKARHAPRRSPCPARPSDRAAARKHRRGLHALGLSSQELGANRS